MTFSQFIARKFRLSTLSGRIGTVLGFALLVVYDVYSPRAVIFDLLFVVLLFREFFRQAP